MEPSQSNSPYRQQQQGNQRPGLRLDTMHEKGPPAMAQTFSAATSRSMNSRQARNRAISESSGMSNMRISAPMYDYEFETLDEDSVQPPISKMAKVTHRPMNIPQPINIPQAQSQMERRETGTLIPPSQRTVTSSIPFGSAPLHGGGFSSMQQQSPRKVQQHQFSQNARQSPSMESPELLRYGDSPRSGSYNQSELLDDLIIDEILSLEDEQRRSGGKASAQPIPGSYSCADNLTQLSGSNARPIPGAPSSGGSGHSGSPITIGSAIGGTNFRQVVSSSAPTSSIDMDQMMLSSQGDGEDYYRDRRKKDIHNMIERRRRYNINDRIKELGMMLPKASAELRSDFRDMKLNKGTILKASCDYIRQLQKERDQMVKSHQQHQRLESTAKQYADRVRELEEAMARQGVQVPASHLPPLPRITALERPIKQELDETASPNQTPCGSLSSGFMSQLSDGTAAMQIASPLGRHMQPQSASDSYFSVGSSSPPEYGTPHHNWRDMQPNFPDLIMEDMASMQGNPLMSGGDPLISQAGAHPSPHLASSQMSPDIQWDQSGFSPDGHNGMHQQQMDYS